MSIETVPTFDIRDGSKAESYWHGTGGWISVVRGALGDEVAFGLILSRIAHDLREEYGVAGAQVALEGAAKETERSAH